MSGEIIYSPETMTYTLSNGTDRIKLPNWAHIVIKDEVEREIMPLNNKIEILSDALALARDENTKLRELVRDMWDWLAPTAVGGGAPLKRLHNRMRELVVDV